MEIAVIAAIAAASTVFVLWPLFRGGTGLEGAPAFPRNQGREKLLQEKGAAIDALKEIEFDYLSGKLSHDDYSRLRSGYENGVVRLLKKLDELDSEDPLSTALEEEINAARGRGLEVGEGCPICHCHFPEGSNYCPACGASINRSFADGEG